MASRSSRERRSTEGRAGQAGRLSATRTAWKSLISPGGGEQTEQRRAVEGLTSVFRANVPQLFVDVDRDGVHDQGGRAPRRLHTLQVYLGSLYVNDFNRFGRTWQVIVQADAQVPRPDRRHQPAEGPQHAAGRWCRSARWPTSREVNGPLVLTRYNMYPAASINGNAAPGRQLGPGDRR